MSNLIPSEYVIKTLRCADAICFDVDSTIIPEEGIDVLATLCGCGDEVSKFTSSAMNGKMTMEEALEERLKIMKIKQKQLIGCIAKHQPNVTNGFESLTKILKQQNKQIFLVSGGFRQMINHLNNHFDITHNNNIYANNLIFENDDAIATFDRSEPTSRSGGKAVVIQKIKSNLKQQLNRNPIIIMIGDGATDLETRNVADLFVGYGGIVERPIVKEKSDWFIKNWSQLIDVLGGQNPQEINRHNNLPN